MYSLFCGPGQFHLISNSTSLFPFEIENSLNSWKADTKFQQILLRWLYWWRQLIKIRVLRTWKIFCQNFGVFLLFSNDTTMFFQNNTLIVERLLFPGWNIRSYCVPKLLLIWLFIIADSRKVISYSFCDLLLFCNHAFMVNTNCKTMQNIVLGKWFSCSCKRTTFLLFHHVFLGISKWHNHFRKFSQTKYMYN